MAKLSTQVQWLTDGEKANASVLNRPLQNIVDYIDGSLGSYEVESSRVDVGVSTGDLVYIDPEDGKIKKSIKSVNNTQTQNVIGRYSLESGTHLVLLSGLYSEKVSTFIPGSPYYLSTSEAGKMTTDYYENAIVIGKALSDKDFIIDIKGYTYVPSMQALTTPVISKSVNGSQVTFTITSFDSDALSHSWDIVGNYTLISGSLNETLNGSITVEANDDTTIIAKVKSIADNIEKMDSSYSSTQSETFEIFTKLSTPVITSGTDGLNITFSINSSDVNALSHTWELTGNYTLESGSLTGTLGTTIVISTNEGETVTAKVKSIGDGDDYTDSNFSNTISKTISLDPSLVYDTSLLHDENESGVKLTDPDEAPVSTFYFNATTYNASTPALVMFFSTNGRTSKLDFAEEYTGDTFEVVLDSVSYEGAFAENSDYTNPTVINTK